MRFLLPAILVILLPVCAPAGLYVQKDSISPDHSCAFAINYPPVPKSPDGFMQACFVNPKTQKRIGDFFYLPYADAETYAPGSYIYENYHNFDYAWSADSTHVAVTNNYRHGGRIFPFRRSGTDMQMLQMPDLAALLKERLAGVLRESIHTSITASHWEQNHRLVVTISRDAQVTDTSIPADKTWNEKDWRNYLLRFTISFDPAGKPTIETTKFTIGAP